MICPDCGQDQDVTAHSCPGPPRGMWAPREAFPFDTHQERRVRQIIREVAAPSLGARIELGKLEVAAEARIREIVRDEISKRWGTGDPGGGER